LFRTNIAYITSVLESSFLGLPSLRRTNPYKLINLRFTWYTV